MLKYSPPPSKSLYSFSRDLAFLIALSVNGTTLRGILGSAPYEY
jgi:hypothetical protein